MNRILTISALVVLLGASAASQAPQTSALPTVDQILDKYVTAVGGRAAIEKITSFRAKGTIQVPSVGISGTIELFQKAPDKAATIVELSGIGRQREVFDGAIAFSEDQQNGVRDKSGVELVEAKRSATFGRELKLKTLYKTLTVQGRDKVDGKDAFVVEAVPAEGTPTKMFFDAESGLLVRQTGSRTTPEGPLEVTLSYSDFRAIDGVKRPFTINQATPLFSAVIQLTEITHNVAIDDAMFKK